MLHPAYIYTIVPLVYYRHRVYIVYASVQHSCYDRLITLLNNMLNVADFYVNYKRQVLCNTQN